jgi:hypothetical protein
MHYGVVWHQNQGAAIVSRLSAPAEPASPRPGGIGGEAEQLPDLLLVL